MHNYNYNHFSHHRINPMIGMEGKRRQNMTGYRLRNKTRYRSRTLCTLLLRFIFWYKAIVRWYARAFSASMVNLYLVPIKMLSYRLVWNNWSIFTKCWGPIQPKYFCIPFSPYICYKFRRLMLVKKKCLRPHRLLRTKFKKIIHI